MPKDRAWEAFARYVDCDGKLCLIDCGVLERKTRRLVCRMSDRDDEKTRLANAAVMAQAKRMKGILERMLDYDFRGNVLGVRPYNGCLEDIQKTLKEMEWKQ